MAQHDHVPNRLRHGCGVAFTDERATSHALLALNQPGVFQTSHRLPDGRSAHAELLGEIALRRQPVTGFEIAQRHLPANLFTYFLESSLRFDWRKSRAASRFCGFDVGDRPSARREAFFSVRLGE